MKIIIIAIITIVCIFLYRRSQKEETPNRQPAKYSRKAYARRFKIAGISYRCTRKDIGVIMGKVGYDPSNEHDPNAIAIRIYS